MSTVVRGMNEGSYNTSISERGSMFVACGVVVVVRPFVMSIKEQLLVKCRRSSVVVSLFVA